MILIRLTYAEYDKKVNVENIVGEAKGEGLGAIPSAKFKNNYAFSQIIPNIVIDQ